MKKQPFAVLSAVALAGTMIMAAPSSVLAAPTTPVILVPGIGGSQLYGSLNSKNTDGIVWVDKLTDSFALDFLVNDEELAYNLKLKRNSFTDPSSVVPANTGVSIWSPTDDYGLRSISFLDADSWTMTEYFNPFINTLKAQGYVPGQTLFGLPHDWRQDYAKHYPQITNTINQALAASGASKVAFIAHSQGGLIMKSYLLAHPEMAAKIDRFITVGTPFLGAAKAAKATSQKLGGYDFGVPLINSMTGFSIAQYSPAVYHLAPSYEYENQMFHRYGRGTINSYVSPALVPTTPAQGYWTQLKNFEFDQAMFDYSASKHGVWDFTAPNVPRYHLVSDTVATDVAYNYTYCAACAEPNQLEYVIKAGDGTVPLISAEKPGGTGGKMFYVHDDGATGAAVSHTDMVKTPNVMAKLLDILRDSPDAPVAGIDTTVNRSLDGQAFTAYSFTAPSEQFAADLVVTNVKTGQKQTIRVNGSEYDLAGEETGAVLRTSALEDGSFNVQLLMKAGDFFDIEMTSKKNADLKVRSYESNQKGIEKRASFGKLKQAEKDTLKIEHRQGQGKLKHNGKALQAK